MFQSFPAILSILQTLELQNWVYDEGPSCFCRKGFLNVQECDATDVQ